jgi:hypothetical protein
MVAALRVAVEDSSSLLLKQTKVQVSELSSAFQRSTVLKWPELGEEITKRSTSRTCSRVVRSTSSAAIVGKKQSVKALRAALLEPKAMNLVNRLLLSLVST